MKPVPTYTWQLRQVMAAFLGLRMLSDRRRVAMAIPSVQAEQLRFGRTSQESP